MQFQEHQLEQPAPPLVESSGHFEFGAAGTNAERNVEGASRTGPHRWHSFLKGILRKSCLLDLLSCATARDRVEILLYHGFCAGSRPDPRFPKLMPIDLFEEHVRICARYLPPLSLDQLLKPGSRGVVITFDDGYANNFDLAFPVLRKYRMPATVFLTTGFVDRSTPLWGNWLEFLVMAAQARDSVFEWRDSKVDLPLTSSLRRTEVVAGLVRALRQLPIADVHEFLRALENHLKLRFNWKNVPNLLQPLTWDQVRTMRQSGLVSFGCHTVSHPVLSRCTREAQTFEILESKRRIEEELGEDCTTFAYPYGKHSDYTEATRQIVRSAGFDFVLSAESGSTKPSTCNPYELPRWGADLELNELSFLVSGGAAFSGYLKEHGRRWERTLPSHLTER